MYRCHYLTRSFRASRLKSLRWPRARAHGLQCARSLQRPSFAADREQLEIVSWLLSPSFLSSVSSLSLSLIASDADPFLRPNSSIPAGETLRAPLPMAGETTTIRTFFTVHDSPAYDRSWFAPREHPRAASSTRPRVRSPRSTATR